MLRLGLRRKSLLDHVIGDNDEQMLEAVKLWADSLQKSIELRIGEIAWQGFNGLDKVVRLHTFVSGSGGRDQLKQRPRLVVDHVVPGPWVRVLIALTQQPKDGDASACRSRDAIPDINALESWRQRISSDEELAELVTDLSRQLRGQNLDLVDSLGVLRPASAVGDIGDRHLPPHQDGEDSKNIGTGLNLPLFGLELGKPTETGNHEESFGPNVLLEV